MRVLALLAAIGLFLVSGDPLDEKIASMLPTERETKWMSVPWRLNLLAARVEAERTGKPMFLWIMNGHPMGCT